MAKHRSIEERAKIIARYRDSGLTQREFCEGEGVTRSALKSWLYDGGAKRNNKPRFVEVTATGAPQDTRAVELRLGDVRVLLPTTLTDERIAELVVALERRARRPR
ncbi:MAG: hypothetical protein K0V04_27640 [Deltaproteobacteria bacterium]|nr:hypothetical protein [Deltaproteobacteria bacterium]